ncbi:hypothetical protein KZP17_09005 [Bifidobacterium pseudocatenulatum]|uniref:hypothetical protein n=1 Tax=Bifidobacterium pseudocatenulatum TaxID=28026 RepID=UPI001CFE94A1|nr:hypothetical protein [Bifidobacterium pseudocatenulatum]MCB4902539.1 hypothetical protein [Bifidobacterium pseudocatenulatum]
MRPQTNPYAANQQYAQTPQYGQPQYQQTQYAQYQYGQQPYVNPQPADTGSFGWAVLGFFFPIVGLILFLVWKSEKPVSAKQAGMGALASVISTLTSSPRFKPGDSSYRFAVGEVLVSKRLPRIRV